MYKNLRDDNTQVSLQSQDQMAIMIEIKWTKGFYDGNDIRDKIHLSFQHNSFTRDTNGAEIHEVKSLPFDKCSEYDFPGYRRSFSSSTYLHVFHYWFNITNSTVAGSIGNANIYENLVIKNSKLY